MNKSRTPRDRFPSRFPRDAGPRVWFYEERTGLSILTQVQVHPGTQLPYTATTTAKMPWKALCTAVDRYRKARRKRGR